MFGRTSAHRWLVLFVLVLTAIAVSGSECSINIPWPPIGEGEGEGEAQFLSAGSNDDFGLGSRDDTSEGSEGEGEEPTDSQSRDVVEPDVVRLDGDLLYVLNQFKGLLVVDLSDPEAPEIIGRGSALGAEDVPGGDGDRDRGDERQKD